jgi:prepilin-type N-terminal cleavage/methylation domain-containing protein
MKKSLKGFTLVELVIVMAIMTILLAGILQLFAPVRAAYTETAALESKRANCNSITKYMTESLRYAQYIGVYNSGSASGEMNATDAAGAQKAAQALLDAIKTANATMSDADIDAIAENIQVIVVDYKDREFMGQKYSGRLWRYKTGEDYTPSSNTFTTPTNFHMSFGSAYYGANSFGIKVTYDGTLLSVDAATQGFNNGGGDVVYSGTTANKIVSTNGAVKLNNIGSSAAGKLFFATDTHKPTSATNPTLILGSDGLPDTLQGDATVASGEDQYFFAFIPAEDMPN